MPLSFHPDPGQLLICDHGTGFRPPEMVKRRPVVVVSPRLRRQRGLCTVVPLSGTAPDPPQNHHCRVEIGPPLPAPWDSRWFWANWLSMTIRSIMWSPRAIPISARAFRTAERGLGQGGV